MQDHLDPKRRYLCRHIHTDGRRCGSPALRAQTFCYYHDRQRLLKAQLAGRTGMFRMQPIDDRAAIQIAIFDVLSRITAGDIDNKRASILLYGLQIASSNLARQEKLQPATQPIEDVTPDHLLGDLAPIAEILDDEPATDELSNTEEIPATDDNAGTEPPNNSVILSERSESKDPRISAPTEPETSAQQFPTCHPEPTAKDLSSSPATEPESPPIPSNQRHPGRSAAESKDPEELHPATTPCTFQTPAPLSENSGQELVLAAVQANANHPSARRHFTRTAPRSLDRPYRACTEKPTRYM